MDKEKQRDLLKQKTQLVIERLSQEEYLSEEERTAFIEQLKSVSLEDPEVALAEFKAISLKIMDKVIANRLAKIMSVEQFTEYCHSVTESDNGTEVCGKIMDVFDTLYDANEYDKAGEYFEKIDFEKTQNHAIPAWIYMSSNPIQPLLRPIPKKEKVAKALEARNKLAEKAKTWYTNTNREDLAKSMKSIDYDKEMEDYDMLFCGNAPKE